MREQAGKDDLSQVLFIEAPGQVRAHDLHYQRIELTHKRVGGVVVAALHALQQARPVRAAFSHTRLAGRKPT
jgi:hypothetical protein